MSGQLLSGRLEILCCESEVRRGVRETVWLLRCDRVERISRPKRGRGLFLILCANPGTELIGGQTKRTDAIGRRSGSHIENRMNRETHRCERCFVATQKRTRSLRSAVLMGLHRIQRTDLSCAISEPAGTCRTSPGPNPSVFARRLVADSRAHKVATRG